MVGRAQTEHGNRPTSLLSHCALLLLLCAAGCVAAVRRPFLLLCKHLLVCLRPTLTSLTAGTEWEARRALAARQFIWPFSGETALSNPWVKFLSKRFSREAGFLSSEPI